MCCLILTCVPSEEIVEVRLALFADGEFVKSTSTAVMTMAELTAVLDLVTISISTGATVRYSSVISTSTEATWSFTNLGAITFTKKVSVNHFSTLSAAIKAAITTVDSCEWSFSNMLS